MKNRPSETTAPASSRVRPLLAGASFCDAWSIRAAHPELDALSQFLRVAGTTPKWIDRLMRLRNRIVGIFGLKDLGGLSGIDPAKKSSQYQVGDRVGIFTLVNNSADEVLLGDDDKHLKVFVSVHKRALREDGNAIVTVTTVVHVKNWLGRLYMLPVTPAHRIIARRMVMAVGNAV